MHARVCAESVTECARRDGPPASARRAYYRGVEDPNGRLALQQTNDVMRARTAKHAQDAIDALAVAGAQLYHWIYNTETQRRVHDAFANYELSASFCNPQRTSRRYAVHAFHAIPSAERGPSWDAANDML
jgi:hypothetical protein